MVGHGVEKVADLRYGWDGGGARVDDADVVGGWAGVGFGEGGAGFVDVEGYGEGWFGCGGGVLGGCERRSGGVGG